MRTPSIVVLGDIMVDITKHCNVTRISSEAPVPVCKLYDKTFTLGGAGNVAMNLAHFLPNYKIILLGWIDDRPGSYIFETLRLPDNLNIISPEPRAVIEKTRVVDIKSGYQLIRIDNDIKQESLPTEWALKIIEPLNLQAIVFSDYCKGTLGSADLVTSIVDVVSCSTFVDTKDDEVSRYRYVDYITPNVLEFETLCKRHNATGATDLIKTIGIDNILLTCSEEGADLYSLERREDKDVVNFCHADASSSEVIDVTGAGDTLLAAFVGGIVLGKDPYTCLTVASKLAGEVCCKRGTAVPTSDLIKTCADMELGIKNDPKYPYNMHPDSPKPRR